MRRGGDERDVCAVGACIVSERCMRGEGRRRDWRVDWVHGRWG